MSEKLVEGFTCACGTYHKYPAYVYAHWDELLTHTCDECGRQHQIIRGKALPVETEGKE